MWLRDFLPERKAIKETARMFLHGYYSRIEGSTSTASVGDYAKRILLLLSETRKQKESTRPLIFVCHFLGGLIVKKASADAGSPENPYRTILESCVGLLFFGVPNQGLETSELLSVVGDQNNAHLLQDLKKSSNLLRTMHEDFVEILFSIR
ncbi:hypothetical protein FPQ18DRAFT_417651, partial [Pyronema domesticum]